MSKKMVAFWLALMTSAGSLTVVLPAYAVGEAQYNTARTEIGTLLDDPATRALLDKYIPGMTSSDQIDMARAMTLKDIQPYSPDSVTDKILAELDAEFAKLSAKK